MHHDHAAIVPTAVPGLDEVLIGGLLRRGFYLVQGDPGSGKTTLALQFLRGRAAIGGRCLYVTLTETTTDLRRTCESHGWTLDGIDVCDLTRAAADREGESAGSVFHPAEIELGETVQAAIDAVRARGSEYVVLDGLSELRLMAGDALRYRRELLGLKAFLEERGATVLLLDDRSSPFGMVQPESLVGGNIVLERILPAYGSARRRLFVTKVRGGRFREGYHDYQIAQGGVIVHPRLVAAEHHDRFSQEAHASGVPGLDAMLQGGLSAGTTTLLLGPAGVGKSTVAMQYVVHAMRHGSKAAVFLFDEVLGTLMERAGKLCAGDPGGLRSFVEGGHLHAQQIDPAELSPGAFAHVVRHAVDGGARIVVIDSLNGYLNAMPEERFLTTHLHELFAYLNQKGVTTIMVVAQHGMIVGSGSGDLDVSYLADAVLLFRYFEANAEIRQAISVFKKRTGPHERTLRELKITTDGIRVGEPLTRFRGIMTGVPRHKPEVDGLRAPPEDH